MGGAHVAQLLVPHISQHQRVQAVQADRRTFRHFPLLHQPHVIFSHRAKRQRQRLADAAQQQEHDTSLLRDLRSTISRASYV